MIKKPLLMLLLLFAFACSGFGQLIGITNGSTIPSTYTFQWQAQGATEYLLDIGTQWCESGNLYSNYLSTTSATVSNMPYGAACVSLYTYSTGQWSTANVTIVAAPQFSLNPGSGTQLPWVGNQNIGFGPVASFALGTNTWPVTISAGYGGPGSTDMNPYIVGGTNNGSGVVFQCCANQVGIQYLQSNLQQPVLYVRLQAGGVTQDFTYFSPAPRIAITSPTNGAQLTSANPTFTLDDGGVGPFTVTAGYSGPGSTEAQAPYVQDAPANAFNLYNIKPSVLHPTLYVRVQVNGLTADYTFGAPATDPSTLAGSLSVVETDAPETSGVDDYSPEAVRKRIESAPTTNTAVAMSVPRSGATIQVNRLNGVNVGQFSYKFAPNPAGGTDYSFTMRTYDAEKISMGGPRDFKVTSSKEPAGWSNGPVWIPMQGYQDGDQQTFTVTSDYLPGLVPVYAQSTRYNYRAFFDGGAKDLSVLTPQRLPKGGSAAQLAMAKATSPAANSHREFMIGPTFPPGFTKDQMLTVIKVWVTRYGQTWLQPVVDGGTANLVQTISALQPAGQLQQDVQTTLLTAAGIAK